MLANEGEYGKQRKRKKGATDEGRSQFLDQSVMFKQACSKRGCCAHAGQDKGNLLEALKDSNCWLEFKVKWKGWSSHNSPDGTTWEHEKSLNCDEILFKFVCKVRQEKHVPLPGE